MGALNREGRGEDWKDGGRLEDVLVLAILEQPKAKTLPVTVLRDGNQIEVKLSLE